MHGSSDGGRHRGRSVRKNQVGIGRAGFSVLKRIWLMLVVFAPPSPLGVVDLPSLLALMSNGRRSVRVQMKLSGSFRRACRGRFPRLFRTRVHDRRQAEGR